MKYTNPSEYTGPEQQRVRPQAAPESTRLAPDYVADDAISLHDVVDVLMRGKWLILASLLVVVSLVAAYTFTVAPEYEAYTTMLIDTESQGADIGSLLGLEGATSWVGQQKMLANETMVLQQSLPIAEDVAAGLLEQQVNPETGELLSILEPNDEGEAPSVMGVVRRLQENVVTISTEGRDVDVIRISAMGVDPVEAAMIANLYREAYQNYTQADSRQRFVASRVFLEEQEELLKSDLLGLENDIQAFMSSEQAVALDEEAEKTVEQVAVLEAQRDEAIISLQMIEATLVSLRGELQKLEPRMVMSMASGSKRELEISQGKLIELELQRESLYSRNPDLETAPIDDWPVELRAIERQISQLRMRIDSLSEAYANEVLQLGGIDLSGGQSGMTYLAELNRQIVDLQVQQSGLVTKIELLKNRIVAYDERLSIIPGQAIELARLQRAQTSAERLYVFIAEKLQEARVAEQSEVGYVKTIRRALVPDNPMRPRKVLNLALSLVLGLALGVGLAFLWVNLDRRIHRPEDLKEHGFSALGIIPRMDKIIVSEFGGAETVNIDNRNVSSTLMSLLNPLSPVVESYRQLRTNIQFATPDTVIQTLLVTSAGAGEGKTVTSTNLGIVMAQSGRRTLIVEMDLRRPQVHRRFGLSKEPGIVDLLFSSADSFDMAQFEVADDLYVVPAGTRIPNPSELMGSKRMRDFIFSMREMFDVIIFDTPPVLVATDAILLATQCDATLLVTSAGKSETHELDHARDALRNVGANLIGCVLNNFDASKAHGYKYKYSYYRYGYGSKYKEYYQGSAS